MKILITGATGLVASHLIPALLKAGHQVRAIVRSQKPHWVTDLADQRFTWDELPSALKGCDGVIHLAGAPIADHAWSDSVKKEILESRVLTTRALVNAWGKLPEGERPKVLISGSAVGFYGDRGSEELTETSPSSRAGFLAEVCLDWESEALKAQAHGARVICARTGIVLAPDGGMLDRLRVPFETGLGAVLGTGLQWMSWIHVNDLTSALVRALTDTSLSGPINMVSPSPLTNAQFTAALAGAVKTKARARAPKSALKLLLGEMSEVVLGSQRVIPLALERSGFSFRFKEISHALEDCAGAGRRTFIRYQRVKPAREEIFEFFCNPDNLEAITPASLSFKVLSSSTHKVGPGTVIDYALKVHGLPMRWTSLIDSWVENESFVDVQLKGPYSQWHHRHTFHAMPRGGTLLGDQVDYKLPLGPLGSIVAGSFVASDVEQIFAHRHEVLAKKYGS